MKNKYSISEIIKNSFSFLFTKLFFRKARFIRLPFYLRGKKPLNYGDKLTTGRCCRFDLSKSKDALRIGKNCEFGDYTHIVAHNSVTIGDNVLIASKAFISDTNHGNYRDDGHYISSPNERPKERKLVFSFVEIGNNCWIGENVVILSGVSIGSGTIVGANSVVTNDLPCNCIAVGLPAKAIKTWNEQTGKWVPIKSK